MIKSELVRKIAALNNLKKTDSERLVTTIFETITNALAEGNRVELRGFGVLSVRTRKARMARNPKTGVSVAVKEKHIPFFKAGKTIHDALNKK